MKTSELLEQVKVAYAAQPDLLGLVDESVIDTLGLTGLEVKVLAALLVAEGHVTEAWERIPEVKREAFDMTVKSLMLREIVKQDPQMPSLVEFDTTQVRMQQAHEVEEVEGEPPSVKLVLVPMRERVIRLVRSADTAARGLARVYTLLYGPPKGSDWGLLGAMAREMGRDQAALFLLEFAHRQMQYPLNELIPLAKARIRGFRPADAPEVAEQRQYVSAIAEEAWKKRTRRWLATRDLKSLSTAEQLQYQADIAEWKRRGKPEL